MSEFSGRTTAYSHKFDDWNTKPCNGSPALSKVWYLDVQWSDCPVEVESEVIKMWRNYELGNDNYILKFTLEELLNEEEAELTVKFIKERQPDIANDELIIIHWWW